MDGTTLRGYILEYLYEKGYEYIINDGFGEVYAVDAVESEYSNYIKGSKRVKYLGFCELFEDVTCSEPLNIACEIGAIDWSTVPENTPVLVRHNESEPWEYRHFYKYSTESDYPFICYIDGKTSYTVKSIQSIVKYDNWEFCKLAEEEWKPGRMDYEELELLHHFAESFVDIEREEIEEGKQC